MDYREMKKEHAEHTLKVVGHGKVELMPDEVEIVFFLQQQDKSFVKAQTKVKARFGELERMVADFGLPRTALQTLRFETGKAMEPGFFRAKMKGYLCSCEAKLVFDLKTGLLDAVLAKLAESVEEMPYEIRYRLRDATIEQANLLGLAAADARRKAEQLAEGLGTHLGEIAHVEYERAPHREVPHYAYCEERSCVRSRFEGVMDMIMPWEDEDVMHGGRRSKDSPEQKHEGAQGSYVPQPMCLAAEVKVEWYFG